MSQRQEANHNDGSLHASVKDVPDIVALMRVAAASWKRLIKDRTAVDFRELQEFPTHDGTSLRVRRAAQLVDEQSRYALHDPVVVGSAMRSAPR